MAFANFMATPIGRGLRIVAGLVLIVVGFTMGSTGGYILAAVGLVPLIAGVANVCFIAPLIKAPFSGKSLTSTH